MDSPSGISRIWKSFTARSSFSGSLEITPSSHFCVLADVRGKLAMENDEKVIYSNVELESDGLCEPKHRLH
jgi:hypothetical protein